MFVYFNFKKSYNEIYIMNNTLKNRKSKKKTSNQVIVKKIQLDQETS